MRHSSILRRALLVALLAIVIVPVWLNAQEEDISYTVVRGDNLLTIAERFDAQFECIVANNSLDENFTLYPDVELLIPAECPPFGTPPLIDGPISEDDLRPGDELYVVQPRDVLLLIAEGVDKSYISIALFSVLENIHLIYPGTQLIIPFDAPPFGITPALFIYDPSTETWFPILAGGEVPLDDGEQGYVVQRGDNLDLIAVSFDVRVTCLQERNGLIDSITIFPGDVIVIPTGCQSYNGTSSALPLRGYVIEPGEGGGLPTTVPTSSDISGEAQSLQEALSGGTSTPTPTRQSTVTPTTAATLQATPLNVSTIAPTGTLQSAPIQATPTNTLEFTPTRRPTVTPTPTLMPPTVQPPAAQNNPAATEEAAG